MSDIRFFTDEDVDRALAEILRSHGCDAVSTPEADRVGPADPDQLEWCRENGRAIIAFNVGHFAALHEEWLAADRHHAGVIVSNQRPIGDVTRRVLRLARSLTGEEMIDRLKYLSNWPSA